MKSVETTPKEVQKNKTNSCSWYADNRQKKQKQSERKTTSLIKVKKKQKTKLTLLKNYAAIISGIF